MVKLCPNRLTVGQRPAVQCTREAGHSGWCSYVTLCDYVFEVAATNTGKPARCERPAGHAGPHTLGTMPPVWSADPMRRSDVPKLKAQLLAMNLEQLEAFRAWVASIDMAIYDYERDESDRVGEAFAATLED